MTSLMQVAHKVELLLRASPVIQSTYVRTACHMSQKKRRRLRRQAADMSWADAITEFQQAAGNRTEAAEPHMLHAIWKVRSTQSRPWWEKNIMHRLGFIEYKCSGVPVIQKNTPSVNEMLKEVKHLVRIKPLTFPHGLPEHPSDFEHLHIKPTGEVIVKKMLQAQQPQEDSSNDDSPQNKWKMSLDTVRRECRRLRVEHKIHTEYHPPSYTYTKNQDGKEYRYHFNDDIDPYLP